MSNSTQNRLFKRHLSESLGIKLVEIVHITF